MKINKALVKHETRNMKWMLLYFLLVALGGILYFNASLNGQHIGLLMGSLTPDRSIILGTVNEMINMIIFPMGLGILLMIFLQFKDSKSVEVGNFLKALPISNREYFTIKLVGGLLSLTLPTIILMVGVLLVRNSNMSWISDINSTSFFTDLMTKSDSIINIISILTMTYMVAISTYTFLFMIQYIVMNITAGIVIGSLVWLSPIFLIGSIGLLYGDMIYTLNDRMSIVTQRISNYIQPWLYPLNSAYSQPLDIIDSTISNNIQFIYYEGVLIKILITLLIAIASIVVGYLLAKKSKVEDSDTFISFKWARTVFIIGVTICSALLLAVIPQTFLGRYNYVGFLVIHVIMIIGAIIGFIISTRITRVKNK